MPGTLVVAVKLAGLAQATHVAAGSARSAASWTGAPGVPQACRRGDTIGQCGRGSWWPLPGETLMAWCGSDDATICGWRSRPTNPHQTLTLSRAHVTPLRGVPCVSVYRGGVPLFPPALLSHDHSPVNHRTPASTVAAQCGCGMNERQHAVRSSASAESALHRRNDGPTECPRRRVTEV